MKATSSWFHRPDLSATVPIVAMRQKFSLISIALLVIGGCASESHPKSGTLSELTVFTIGEQPQLTIADDDTPARQFTRISARRLESGDITIADQAPARIAIFGRDGVVKREVARQGQGPGELPGTFTFTSLSDTIVAIPSSPMAVSAARVFNLAATAPTEVAPDASNETGRITLRAPISTTSWIVSKGSFGRVLYSVPPVGTFAAETTTLGILSTGTAADSSRVRWLPPFVQYWTLVVPIIGATGANGAPTTLPANYPLRGGTFHVGSGNQLWFVNGERGELRAYDSSGRATVYSTIALEKRTFNRAQLDSARTAAIARATTPFAKSLALGRYDDKTLPAYMPIFADGMAGVDGEIWLRRFELSDTSPQTYLIVSSEGNATATAVVPAGLSVQQIGKDFLLAVNTDAVGRQSVVEYRLRRQ